MKSFPQLVGTVHSFEGNDRDHRALVEAMDAHGGWTAGQKVTQVALTPASCYGVYPRMGSNRISVMHARRYASQGFTSLRLDLAGVGDSEAAPEGDSVVYNLKSCADVAAAVDWLEARGHKRVVLVGMCSGGYLGFQVAQRDKRVVGQILVNPQRFEWTDRDSLEMVNRVTGRATRQLVGDGLRAVMRPGKLGRLLSGDPAAWRMARVVGEKAMKSLRARLGRNSDTAVARDMRGLLDRGVKTLLVFSAGDSGLAECAQQFGEGLERVDPSRHLAFKIIEGASHTLAEKRWASRIERASAKSRSGSLYRRSASRPSRASM